MSNNIREIRGVQKLAEEALHHGSKIVERIQIDTANRTFAILDFVPVVAPTSRIVKTVFDATVALSHGSIRWVNKAVHRTIDVALDATLPTDEAPESKLRPSDLP